MWKLLVVFILLIHLFILEHTGLQMPTMVTLNPILLLDGRNFKNKLEIKGMILTLCFCPKTRKLDNYYFEDD